MKTSIFKFGSYGLIFALALFLAVLYLGLGMDYSTQEVLGYLTILVSLSFVYFGIKHFRDRQNHGKVGFWKAMAIGLLISAFTAVGIAIADYIYTTAINPDFFEEYAALMREEGYTGEIPDYGSGFMSFIMFVTVMMVGLVVSVLSALILKRA